MRKYIVAIDFDHTLAKVRPWNGVQTAPGPPNPGMAELVRKLKIDLDCTVVVWTCRNSDEVVKNWCEKYSIDIDGVNVNLHPTFNEGSPKIYADVYIDDKGLHYNGESEGLFEQIKLRKRNWHYFEKGA